MNLHNRIHLFGFTLVEMLMALLIVSIILSASLPVISSRQKAVAQSVNQNAGMPIGGIILWTDMETLPDNTWLECNGATIPAGIEYEDARRVFGENLPDLRNMRYPLPNNMIGIWGSTDDIPSDWSEATEYRGYFLRGYGSTPAQTYSWTDGKDVKQNVSVVHTSANINAVQGNSIMDFGGNFAAFAQPRWLANGSDVSNGVFSSYSHHQGSSGYNISTTSATSSAFLGGWSYSFHASRGTPTSNEIRPVNKAVRYVKYTPAQKNYRYIAKVRV